MSKHDPKDMLPAPPCYLPTEEVKDRASRWLPTVVALLGVLGQTFYFGQRLGAAEQELKNTSAIANANVSRVEYLAEKSANSSQLQDMKQTLRDMNAKLDRLVERQTAK